MRVAWGIMRVAWQVMRVAYGVCGLHDMAGQCHGAAWHCCALHAGRMVQYAGRMVDMRVAWPLYAGRMTWQFFQRRSDLLAYRSNRSWQLSRLSCGSHMTICGSHDVTEKLVGGYLGSLVLKLGFTYLKGTRGSRILSVSSCLLFPNCRLSLMCWEQ